MKNAFRMINFGLILALLFVVVSGSLVNAIEVSNRGEFNYTRSTSEDAINQGSQIGVDVLYIKINGDEVENGDEIRTQFKRADDLEIRVKLQAGSDADNVEIIAMINGDDHSKIADTSEVFDVESNVIYTKTLHLSLSNIMDQDNYMLRIIVADRYDAVKVYNYLLKIDTDKHNLQVSDLVLTPESVKQGRALLGVVRVRNYGERDEKDVKVTMAIPALGLIANDYIDEIETEDSVSSEELYLRIPNCAKPGKYAVQISVSYDENTRIVTKLYEMEVLENAGACDDSTSDSTSNSPISNKKSKTMIAVSSDVLDVKEGSTTSFPIIISNVGNSKLSYTISVDGVDDWADAIIKPSNVVFVDAGEVKTVYVNVKAKADATGGEHMFVASVSADGTSQTIPLKANVVKSESLTSDKKTSAKTILEVTLIIVIILLVIIGLIVAFNKLKGTDDDEFDEDEKSYY